MAKKGTVFKKYTEAFKLKVVHLYENGERSYDTIAKELKMPSPTPLKNIYGSIINDSKKIKPVCPN
ncbi:transposase [Bacillus mycoides]|uniref:transposase n=1 Tax=Bacillus mycoides TaxID=1405 RepID=UPI0025A2A601|nr:transposase [Bacillus mycoides]MDM5431003.1 transposase [Bacillus mycoides]